MVKYVEAIGLIGALVVYLVPSLEADAREHRHALAITLVNVFLGWTVIGWFAALHAARTPDGAQRLTQIARTARLAMARGTIDKLISHVRDRAAVQPRLAEVRVTQTRVTQTRRVNQCDCTGK